MSLSFFFHATFGLELQLLLNVSYVRSKLARILEEAHKLRSRSVKYIKRIPISRPAKVLFSDLVILKRLTIT